MDQCLSAFATLLHSFALLLLYPDKNQCPQWHVWYGIDEISALPTMSFITIHKEIYTLFSIFDPSDYGNDGQLQVQGINNGPHFSRHLIDAVQSLKCNLQSQLARPNEKRKKWKGGKARKVESPAEATTTTGSNDRSQWKIANVLPSRFKGMPAIMGDFRREARTAAPIRDLFDYPNTQTIVTDFIDVDVGRMPTLAELTALLLEQTTPIL